MFEEISAKKSHMGKDIKTMDKHTTRILLLFLKIIVALSYV
jgi:hypothetical protein